MATKNKLKPVQCGNCKFFDECEPYPGEGICKKDNEYTRTHRVCNKLITDQERREAKLKRVYKPY